MESKKSESYFPKNGDLGKFPRIVQGARSFGDPTGRSRPDISGLTEMIL